MFDRKIKFLPLDPAEQKAVDWESLGPWNVRGYSFVAVPKPRWWERLFPWMKRKPSKVHTWTLTATPSSQERDNAQ